jgi:thioesterase domain-containing protein/acyl carrier protein
MARSIAKRLSQSKLKVISNDVPVEVPRDSVEVTLVEIWEELLEIRPVGIKSNYFELGGHSLLVARLFARINQTFHRSLPIASIFSCPTIEQLATVIRGRTIDSAYVPAPDAGIQVTANSAIVPLQPHGSATPLFIVHGVKGDIVGFYSLAMRAGTDHPVYGVQSQSLLAGEPGLLRLEDQAAYYLSEIRKVQPKGPYYLLGYCFGAKVAVEIAQQLQALGDRVELLGLIDAWQREWVQVIRRKGTVPLSIKQRIARFFGNFAPLSPLAKAAYLPGRLAVRVLPWVYLLGPSLGLRSVPSFMKRPEDINRAAGMNYRLKPWPGKVTLFRASIQPDPRFPRDLGWTKFARDGVEVCDLPGDHDNAFQEPNIQVLAEQVRARLERSDGQPTELCEDEFSVK